MKMPDDIYRLRAWGRTIYEVWEETRLMEECMGREHIQSRTWMDGRLSEKSAANIHWAFLRNGSVTFF